MDIQMNQRFYDALSDYYHLVFDDWDATMRRQGEVLARLLPLPNDVGPLLDVACGIGTQSIALAQLGYRIEGSDISSREVQRANREASARGLQCVFRVDDMRTLMSAPADKFGAVIAMDNALPHLDSDDEIVAAMKAMRRCLLPGGRTLISIRDSPAPLPRGRRSKHRHSLVSRERGVSTFRFGIGSTLAAM